MKNEDSGREKHTREERERGGRREKREIKRLTSSKGIHQNDSSPEK